MPAPQICQSVVGFEINHVAGEVDDTQGGDVRDTELIACHECDTIQRISDLAPGRKARCSCCGAVVARHPEGGLDRPIALYVAASILFVLANAFPFLTLEIQGREEVTTIMGASWALYKLGMGELAVVVLITSVLGPAFLISSSL